MENMFQNENANATDKDKDKELTDEQKANAKLPPGSVIPHPGAAQSQKLADEGIYQPNDQAANAPRVGGESGNPFVKEEDKQLHEDHRDNLAKLPPVPSERAGAASQAK